MIDEADEAQLVGIRFDNGQMLDGIHFDLGRYARHDSLLQDTRAACAAWGHQFSHGYGFFEAQMPSEKMRWIRSLRGAECEFVMVSVSFMRYVIMVYHVPPYRCRGVVASEDASGPLPTPSAPPIEVFGHVVYS